MARENTVKAKVIAFVAANPGRTRKDYISDFMEHFGMTINSASLYHYQLVTKPAREAKEQAERAKIKVEVKPAMKRDAFGRFIKQVA